LPIILILKSIYTENVYSNKNSNA